MTDLDPATAGTREVLLDTLQRHGELNNEVLVQDASDPRHPLHTRFDWDDTVAGHRWRLEQASQIIRSVRIVFKDAQGQPTHLRAFQAIREAPTARAVYLPTEDVMADEVTAAIALRQAEFEFRTLYNRWKHLAEFGEMVRKYVMA